MTFSLKKINNTGIQDRKIFLKTCPTFIYSISKFLHIKQLAKNKK